MKNAMWMMLLATVLAGCNNEPVGCPAADGNAAPPRHDEFAEMKRVVQSGYSPGVDPRFPRQDERILVFRPRRGNRLSATLDERVEGVAYPCRMGHTRR